MATTKQPFKMVGTRLPLDLVAAITKDAKRLGMTTSEWMRMAANRVVALGLTPEQAARYRDERPSGDEAPTPTPARNLTVATGQIPVSNSLMAQHPRANPDGSPGRPTAGRLARTEVTPRLKGDKGAKR